MRIISQTAVVVCLFGAPSLGLINVRLQADDESLAPGEITLVRILAQGTESGLYGLAGDVLATVQGNAQAESVSGSFEWVSEFDFFGQAIPDKVGSPGEAGGWVGFGSAQTALPPDDTYARYEFVEVGHYMVRWLGGGPSITLSFQPGLRVGFEPFETGMQKEIGELLPAVLTPEPASVSLILLGYAMLTCISRSRRAE